MKTIRKESIIKGLKITLDIALIIQYFGVIILLLELLLKSPSIGNSDSTTASMSSPLYNVLITFSNPNLAANIQSIQNKFFLFCNLCGLVNIFALILITLQLRYILKSFVLEDYFNSSNSKRIKKIAMVIFIWVIADYAIRFMPNMVIPGYFIQSSIGINSFHHGLIQGILGLNLKMLIVSVIIYILSIVFKYGSNLKEESSLTI